MPLVALRPLQNAPFIDDWTYAWSVEHLLRTGELKILDWSVSLNVAHVLWGALFCAPFGFSFTALRLSTWVTSLGGLLGLYTLLRELGASRADTLVGVALVAFYPVYFILSFSFMTDVPFVAMVTWFFAALVRALKRHSSRALAAAVLFACLAVAIRPVGVFLSGVLLLAPWPPSTRWSPSLRRLAVAAAPVVVVVLLTLARPALTAYRADLTWIQGSWAWRMVTFKFGLGLADLPAWLAMNLTLVIGTLGGALAPLALGSLSRENVRRALPGGLLAAALLSGGLLFRKGVGGPLDPEFTWSLRELGATEALVPPLTTAPVRSLGWALAAMLVATLLLALTLVPLLRRRSHGEASSLAWGALGYFALSTVLWLFYDRYALPLVVIVAALRLGTAGIPRLRLALVGVAMFATVSGLGTWDHLQYSHALWEAVAWARRAGIEERQLDGGYVVNGWLQYAHPEHASRAPNGDVQVPGVNGGEPPRYGIVKRVPPESRVLHAVPYRRIIGSSGSLYVIDRTPGSSRPGSGA
ncbi:MAG: glycosyltransferase family 39 protein [Candidatus Rokuibacteriota bacterium]